MTNQYTARAGTLDQVFFALADTTRRSVLERLGTGPSTASALSEPFDMALPSFMQHLHVLEESKLVRSRKKGRVRTYELTPQPLEAMGGWLEQQRSLWNRRLDQLDHYFKQLANIKPTTKPSKKEKLS
jgi:DNA-binding transcriptional ArsR family regulator